MGIDSSDLRLWGTGVNDDLPGWVPDSGNSDIQHRGGILWHDAPPPHRIGHVHYAWSRMWRGMFDGVERCPCGAARYLDRPEWAWFYPSEREAREARWAAEPVVVRGWRRLVSRG